MLRMHMETREHDKVNCAYEVDFYTCWFIKETNEEFVIVSCIKITLSIQVQR